MWDPGARGSPAWLREQGVDLTAPLHRDSRQVQPGAVYFAAAADAGLRRRHIAEAEERGATWIVSADADDPVSTRLVVVDDPRRSFAWAHAAAWDLVDLDDCPPLLGITGTDGKTTTAEMARIALGSGTCRIGTLGWYDGTANVPGRQTTPPPEEIHAFLAARGPACPGVVVEISSHAGHQGRLAGLPLLALAYTGLGSDHLDYHGDQEAYLAAKLAICEGLHAGSTFLYNADDEHASAFIHRAQAAGVPRVRVVGVGFDHGEVRIRRVEGGHVAVVDGTDLALPRVMPGDYNAWNATAGLLLARAAGADLDVALDRLRHAAPVPGRLEHLASGPDVYVDYAHTPQAVERSLATLRGCFPARRLVAVFGCGGDRDRTKRGPMGRAALTADVAIITSDNCRSESPMAIAADIVAGLPEALRPDVDGVGARVRVVLDRASAIDLGCELAGADGVVAVLGKGHEVNQDIGGEILPWDDRAYVRRRMTETAR